MSLSRPSDRLQNPATKFIDFKNGKFGYYDKEKKERIDIPNFGPFVVLDCSTFTITGFIDTPNLKTGVFANAARWPKKDRLVVKSREKGIIADGTYESIKETVVDKYGLRYTRNAYIYWRGELCCLQPSGDCFSSWMEQVEMKDRNEKKRGSQYVFVEGMEERQKGKIKYQHVFFAFGDPIDPEILNEAIEADKILQAYFDDYFKASSETQADKNDEGGSNELKWYEYSDPFTEVPICKMTASEVMDLERGLGDNGESATPLGRAVESMLKEIEWGLENWQSYKTSQGKILGECSFHQLEPMLTWAMEKAPYGRFRFAVEAAVAHHKGKEVPDYDGGPEDNSEIPF